MHTIHANQALLPGGWANDVLVETAEDGRIARVISEASHSRTNPANSGDTAQQRGNITAVDVLLPAPVNLHSHAFQRAMAGFTESRGCDAQDSFWSWRKLMYQFLDRLTPDDIEAITAFVQMRMLESGYATNIEFHYLHHQPGGQHYENRAELCEHIIAASECTGIGLTLLPVYYQYGGCDQRPASDGQRRFANDLSSYTLLWQKAETAISSLSADSLIGVAPHSLRAVAPEQLIELGQMAPDSPFHMHIAEQQAEVDEVQHFLAARPLQWLFDHMEVDHRWCLIHCTQMTADETLTLAHSGAVAGVCPITESSLGDGIFNGVDFLNAGGRLGIGSDSNIRISLSEELRTLDYSQRLRDHSRAAMASDEHSTGRRLFDAIVQGGAQAAGRHTGRIETGYWADMMTLDTHSVDLEGCTGDTLLDTFVFAGDDRMIGDVWSAGRHMVSEGSHQLRDEIDTRYRAVIRKLRAAVC